MDCNMLPVNTILCTTAAGSICFTCTCLLFCREKREQSLLDLYVEKARANRATSVTYSELHLKPWLALP